MGKHKAEIFSSRERIRRWKSASGVLHLVTVCSLVLSSLWVLPRLADKDAFRAGEEIERQTQRRQQLIGVLDKMARYQKYFNEIHGRFTRDISRLQIRELAGGVGAPLARDYEISVLEVKPNRFVLLAIGTNNSDRVTIDESHRLNANFILPVPARSNLLEEADRLLRLKSNGMPLEAGVFSRYWELSADEAKEWVAVGVRSPVIGVRKEASEPGASIFASVREQMMSRMADEAGREPAALPKGRGGYRDVVDAREVNEWLEAARLAQHIHFREVGRFARRWEDLDGVSDFQFGERIKAVKNLRVHPIELTERGYRLTLEGTSGDLLGEQFTMDSSGSVRQVRYTETLIQQLQETTSILENFQINPIIDDSPPAERP